MSIKPRTAILAAALVVCVTAATAQADAIKTDFVFLIDASSSMSGEINGVRDGFSNFVNGLGADVDARFAIILFGGAPELILDLTSDASLTQTRLDAINIGGANPNIQNDHNMNPEAGLEAIRMALGASTIPLVNNNIPEDGILNFRPDARINLILATDEDSDRPYYADNRVSGQNSNEPSGALAAAWQTEVDNTAAAVISSQAYLNMLVSHYGPSEWQYGDYLQDVSDADLLNYDPAATLTNLVNAGYGDTLQAQVLAAGLIARTFRVAGANDPDFVDNFFAAKIQEVQNDPGVNGSVPEPGTLALFGLGLLGVGVWYRRRRR